MRGAAVLVMMAAAALAAEPKRVILLAELVQLEANRSRTFEFPVAKPKAQLDLGWSVREGGAPVRVLVMSRQSRETLYDSGYERDGQHKVRLEAAGDYLLSMENRQQRLGSVTVETHVSLQFGTVAAPAAAAREVPEERRRWVIGISVALFAAMTGAAALALGPAVARRMREPRI